MRPSISALESEATAERSADPVVTLASPAPDPGLVRAALARIDRPEMPRLLARLAYHRVDGLAYRALDPLRDAVDPWLRSTLKRRYQRQAAATLAQGLALAEVLEDLDRAGVPTAVMRGLRTVEMVYGEAGVRPFEDHDLLVPAAALPATDVVLRRRGFARPAATFYRRGGVIIDIHTDPLGARRRPSRSDLVRLTTDDLLARAMPGRVAGAPSLLLAPEDDLLLLAIHAVKHSFDLAIRSADLAHALARRRQPFSWSTLRRRAEDAGALRLLVDALDVATALGAEPPPDLRLRSDAPALERALLQRARELRPLPWCGEILMLLLARDWAGRIRFLSEAFLPPGDADDDHPPTAAGDRVIALLHQAADQARRRRAV